MTKSTGKTAIWLSAILFDSDDIFMDKNETETKFAYKDDTSDEDRRGMDELEELIEINKLGRYIETGCMYDEIIAKLSLLLNYNVRIKKN